MSALDDEALFLAWLGLLTLTPGDRGHGASALNLVRLALGGDDDGCRPWDAPDDARCEAMMCGAPASLAARMRTIHASWLLVRYEAIGWLSATERLHLRSLTLEQDSAMLAWLDFIEVLYEDTEASTEAYRIVRARRGGTVVGWAVVLYANCPAVFVEPRHRRQGIGRALVERLRMHDARGTWVTRVRHPVARAFWTALGVPPEAP